MSLNAAVQKLAQRAVRRAKLMAAATLGDVYHLRNTEIDELSSCRNVRGRTVFHTAAVHAQVDAMGVILHALGSEILQEADSAGLLPLSAAAEAGQTSAVRYLIKSQADIQSLSFCKLTPLHYAVLSGSVETTSALLEARADTEAAGTWLNRRCATPIIIAAVRNYPQIVTLLGSAQANLETKTDSGRTALALASANCKRESVIAMLAARADPNSRNTAVGLVPLMAASVWGSVEVLEPLLLARADPSLQDFHGQSLTSYIAKNTREETRKATEKLIFAHTSTRKMPSFSQLCCSLS
jgi:ankyrin repeat protein